MDMPIAQSPWPRRLAIAYLVAVGASMLLPFIPAAGNLAGIWAVFLVMPWTFVGLFSAEILGPLAFIAMPICFFGGAALNACIIHRTTGRILRWAGAMHMPRP